MQNETRYRATTPRPQDLTAIAIPLWIIATCLVALTTTVLIWAFRAERAVNAIDDAVIQRK